MATIEIWQAWNTDLSQLDTYRLERDNDGNIIDYEWDNGSGDPTQSSDLQDHRRVSVEFLDSLRSSGIEPDDFVWAIDILDDDVLWDDSKESLASFVHGEVVGAIENSAHIENELKYPSAKDLYLTSVDADSPAHVVIEQPGGHWAVDGRLMTGSSSAMSPEGTSIGGLDFVTFCGVFVITDVDESFWVGGTGDGSNDLDRLTLRYRTSEGIEIGTDGDYESFGLPPAFEEFKVQAVIGEYDFENGVLRVFHHTDSETPFGESTGHATGQTAPVEVWFNSTPFNEGVGGIAYNFTIYDRELSKSEKDEFFNFVDATHGLDRDVRFPSPSGSDPYGVSGAVLWLDVNEELYEDVDATRITRDSEEVRLWRDLSPELLEGTRDNSDRTLDSSGDFIHFSDDYLSFGDQSHLFSGTEGQTGYAVARFSDLDSSLIIANFGGGSDGTFYFGLDSSSELAYTMITNDVGRVDVRDASFSSTDWHLFRFEYDGSEMRIYVDDTEVASDTQGGDVQSANNDLRVGAYDGGWEFEGDIAEIIVFPLYLNQTDRDHITSELQSKYSHLLP